MTALMASLNVSVFSPFRLAREQTDDVTRDTHAERGALRVNKSIVPTVALVAVRQCAAAAREEFYARTVPYLDSVRALNPTGYVALQETMNTYSERFARLADDFAAAYPTWVAAAETRLGSAFRAADYPAAVRDKFRFAFGVTPLPAAAAPDLWLALGSETAERLAAAAANAAQSAAAAATRGAWSRVYDVVEKMRDKLQTGGIFRDSLVSNVADVADVLETLNVFADPALTAMGARLRAELSTAPDALRTDTTARADTARRASALLDEMRLLAGAE